MPAPDRTLVFDQYAAEHLHSAGAFPRDAVVVTGSARLDDIATRIAALRTGGRDGIRAAYRVQAGEPLALLAAKFSEAHGVLPALFASVAASASVRLLIKPHPAETADVYRPLVEGISNISVADPGTDLASLLAAADGLITMNSTVAIDAMTLGIPSLVIGLPNNLSPFVDAGVMLGAAEASMRQALERLLYDQTFRAGLLERAAAFVDRYAMRPDGQAARRSADVILALLERPRGPNIDRHLQQGS